MTHMSTTGGSMTVATAMKGVDFRKLGMWFFLSSEVMFFSGLIAMFVYFKLRNPAVSETLDIPLTTLNTFLLLTSSFTVVRALDAVRRGNVLALWNNLWATWFLGLVFLMGQAMEFSKLAHEGVTLRDTFGSAFFTVTGFHGFHVFIGLVWLSILLTRVFRYRIARPEHALQVEIFGLYWHFVDVVWIFLFTVIYLIR